MTKENKTNEEKHEVIIDTKDTVEKKDDDLTERINRLYGISQEAESNQKQYDLKELEEARKKLILLLMGVVFGGMVIIFLLINPFDWGKNKTLNNQKENNETLESKADEDMPLGEIELSNSTVISLNNLVSFSSSDFTIVDLFPLYSNDVLESKNIPNDIKLYLLRRNIGFYDLLREEKIENYITTCDPNGLVIEKSKFDELVKSILGPNVTIEYKDINYSYYGDALTEKKLTLSYVNNQYIVKCNDYQVNTSFTKFVQQNLTKAIKIENAIELYQKVVFINQNGVYKDTTLSTLITNDKNAVMADYIDKGNTYKYTFVQNDDSFYLSKIELVKEANQ